MSGRRRYFWPVVVSYLVVLGGCLVLTATLPIAFQKSFSITRGNGFPDLQPATAIDVSSVLGAIPYENGNVWNVQPAEKYRLTIVEVAAPSFLTALVISSGMSQNLLIL